MTDTLAKVQTIPSQDAADTVLPACSIILGHDQQAVRFAAYSTGDILSEVKEHFSDPDKVTWLVYTLGYFTVDLWPHEVRPNIKCYWTKKPLKLPAHVLTRGAGFDVWFDDLAQAVAGSIEPRHYASYAMIQDGRVKGVYCTHHHGAMVDILWTFGWRARYYCDFQETTVQVIQVKSLNLDTQQARLLGGGVASFAQLGLNLKRMKV